MVLLRVPFNYFFFLGNTMKLDIYDVDKFIEVNGIKEVTSAYVFAADGAPDPDGIFSYDIFGRVGSNDRKNNFGYIDLKRKFFHPLIYNAVLQMFRNLPLVLAGEKYCIVSPKTGGIKIVPPEEEGAETGIDFFVDNWSKIKWNVNDSTSRERKEALFETIPEELIFVEKWPVLPAYYRDVNFHSKESGKVDMDEFNTFYIKLINTVQSNLITFTGAYATQNNAQTIIVDIHNYISKKISGKGGIIRKAIMGKTVDYAITNVISAPRFNAEFYKDQMIPYNYIGVPLYNVCALFFPLIVNQLENMFYDIAQSTEFFLTYDEKTGEAKYAETGAMVTEKLNSESLRKLVATFIKDKTKSIRTARFNLGEEHMVISSLERMLGRPATVTDILFNAAADVVFNKHVLSTRFPVTGSESLIINRIKILTTEDTVDLSNISDRLTGSLKEYYKAYPLIPSANDGTIRKDKVKWIDTVIPNNSFLKGMGGDFDGKF